MSAAVKLQVLERAEKEIMKLSRTDIGAVYEFMHKFRANPDQPGLDLKSLRGDTRLMAAQVKRDLRALLLHIGERGYLLVGFENRLQVATHWLWSYLTYERGARLIMPDAAKE